MGTFSNHLLQIHQEISINDEDRQPYTAMFKIITDWLMYEMCLADPVFKEIYKGTSLFGCYPNRVRIITPSDFDVFILLDFPFEFNIKTDPHMPGFVQIKSDKWKCYSGRTKRIYREMFRQYIIKGLNRNKLKRWIKNIIEYVLSNRPPPLGYIIEYCPHQVAHNIYAKELREPEKQISLGFVPAIIMPRNKMKSLVRKRACIKNKYYDTFVAIPKPLKGCGAKFKRRLAFQLVNPVAERNIIWNKQNLKIVYRLLKSLRNQYKLYRLKSYLLTAVFLRQVAKFPPVLWQHSIGFVFLYMLNKLLIYLDQDDLPYFWASGFNLLTILTPREVAKYADILGKAYDDLTELVKNDSVTYDEIAAYFKTSAE